MALAVADRLQGTLLLEQLALAAVRQGFTHFWALTGADNQPMLDVFRESGFVVTEKPDRHAVVVELALAPTEACAKDTGAPYRRWV